MKRTIISLFILCFTVSTFYAHNTLAWGQNGHRVVGEIASMHISKRTMKQVEKLLGNESIAMVSNFMDEIKSDPLYDSLKPWHYCTVPDDQTYAEAGTPEEGDVIMGIQYCMEKVKDESLNTELRAFWLKCLIHLVGDVHQPLHVGNGEDRGGNDVKLTYFWEPGNLHRVWDTGIIESQNLSYSEYVAWINHPTKEEVEKWQSDPVITWVNESKELRPMIYDLPENLKISYQYNYKNIGLVNRRLLQAGTRLAGVLDAIFS
jgi:hypothetical protein